MSMHYLGETFDIHGGGADLIFPHHENEIAQSEAATGKPFARYWVHNGLLNLTGEKMSKSVGNVFFISDILKIYKPDVVRLYLLSTHYRSPLDFYEERLREQEGGYERLKQALFLLSKIDNKAPGVDKKVLDGFREAMDDDFNTPKALSLIYSLSRDVFEAFKKNPEEKWLLTARVTLKTMLKVLGLFENEEENNIGHDKELIELILNLRRVLREKKLFDVADKIRSDLLQLSIEIEDTSDGSRWKKI